MTEQFPFSVAFDQVESPTAEPPDSAKESLWEEMIHEISTAVETAGFPNLNTDRWEPFGEGYIFWGDQSECQTLHQLLSEYPVYVQQERNLEPGYYALSEAFFYVTDEGDILRLLSSADESQPPKVVQEKTIPIGAYKINGIVATLDANYHLSQPAKPLKHPEIDSANGSSFREDAAMSPVPQNGSNRGDPRIDPAMVEEMRSQTTQQAQVIEKLETELASLQSQLQIQLEAAQHSPTVEELDAIQQLLSSKEDEIQDYKARLVALDIEKASVQQQLESRIDPDVHGAAQELIATQKQSILHYEQTLQNLNLEKATLQQQLDAKIDPSLYQNLQETLQTHQQSLSQQQDAMTDLEVQVNEWRNLANSKIDRDLYESLQLEVTELTEQIAKRDRTIDELEVEVNRLDRLASERVEQSHYDALLAQVQNLTAQRQEKWYTKLLKWFKK